MVSKASTPRVPVRSAGSVGLCIRSGAMCARSLDAWRAYDDAVTDHDTEKLPRGAALREVGRRGRPDAVGGRIWLIRAVGRSRLRPPLPSSVAHRAAAAVTDLDPAGAARECDQARPPSIPWSPGSRTSGSVKRGVACAIRTLRPRREPGVGETASCRSSPRMMRLRFQVAARADGVEPGSGWRPAQRGRRQGAQEADAHEPVALAAAYGWTVDISDDKALGELLALNGGGP